MLLVMKKTVISTSLIASLIAVSGCAPNSTAQDYTDMIEGATGGLITLSTNKNTKPTYQINSGSTVINYNQPIVIEHKTSVEIDTAAARIKRYYHFSSNEELDNLRNNGTYLSGHAAANAIYQNGHKWESMPGTYYKMGKGVNDDLVTIELEKNGNVTSVFIKYEAAEHSSATKASIEKLFAEVKDVAEGKIR